MQRPMASSPTDSPPEPDGGRLHSAVHRIDTDGDRAEGQGRGGRNSEFLLAFAAALAKDPATDSGGSGGIYALACDTDGIDGTEDNAGAIVYPNTATRAASRGIALKEALAGNDSYGFFADLGDLVVTGPTLTNVNDFRAILITGR